MYVDGIAKKMKNIYIIYKIYSKAKSFTYDIWYIITKEKNNHFSLIFLKML